MTLHHKPSLAGALALTTTLLFPEGSDAARRAAPDDRDGSRILWAEHIDLDCLLRVQLLFPRDNRNFELTERLNDLCIDLETLTSDCPIHRITAGTPQGLSDNLRFLSQALPIMARERDCLVKGIDTYASNCRTFANLFDLQPQTVAIQPGEGAGPERNLSFVELCMANRKDLQLFLTQTQQAREAVSEWPRWLDSRD